MRAQSWGVTLAGLLMACGGATMPAGDQADPSPNPTPNPSPTPTDPARPAPDPGAVTDASTLAVRKLFLGETDRSGASQRDAWKTYGRNIDGLVSTKDAGLECKRAAGASASNQVDGDLGIDNAFGKVFVPFLAPFVASPSKRANEAIEAGARTPVFVVAPSPTAVSTVGFSYLEATSSPSGSSRPFAEAWTENGTPSITWESTVSGGMIRTRALGGPLMLEIPFGGGSFVVPVNVAEVVFAKDGSNGTLSGVVPTEAFIAAFERVSGAMSAQLCGGSTRESIRITIRQASDILQDGTQDPNQVCDGISIGIGFEASPVTASGTAPTPPEKPDPCQ